VLAGCGSADSDASGAPVTRDSAGVTIVETAAPVWGDASPWRVDSAPLLSIGNEDGEDAYLFSRIAASMRRDDGAIIVADSRARELRLFDASGQHQGSFGRRGEGPGEFSDLSRFARCGEELWVDAESRISIWSFELEYLREFATPDMPMWPLVCFDGAGVLVKQDRESVEEVDQLENTIYPTHLLLRVLDDSAGAAARDLFEIPLWQRILVREGRGGYNFTHPFGARTVLAGHGPHLVVGRGISMEVDYFDDRGRLMKKLRGPPEELAITDSMRSLYRERTATGPDSLWRALLEAAGNPMPEQYPAYDELIVDREGHLWVHRFAVPGTNENRWGVFAPNGEFLGHVTLPADLEVHEIGRDYVLGAVFANDVPQVRLHRLTR
jgi:hypothetical protein